MVAGMREGHISTKTSFSIFYILIRDFDIMRDILIY